MLKFNYKPNITGGVLCANLRKSKQYRKKSIKRNLKNPNLIYADKALENFITINEKG